MAKKKVTRKSKISSGKKKPIVGIFSFVCCGGCVISFTEVLNSKFFEYKDKMDIRYSKSLRPVKKLGKMDIAFVEGAISTPEEVEELKEIRKNSKKLVAVGSGAITGWPSDLRNKFSAEMKKKIAPTLKKFGQMEKISPITKFVKADDKIPGCPVEEELFIKKIEGYLK